MPASLSALQQVTELLLPAGARGSSCGSAAGRGMAISDIRGVDGLRFAKGEKLLRCKLAAVYRLVDLNGWSAGIYNHITVSLCFATFALFTRRRAVREVCACVRDGPKSCASNCWPRASISSILDDALARGADCNRLQSHLAPHPSCRRDRFLVPMRDEFFILIACSLFRCDSVRTKSTSC